MGNCDYIRWFRLPVAAIALSWLCGAWGATTRYLEDGKWWINVPAGETDELTAADVEAVMPAEGAHLDLYKIGEGTLNMATNDTTQAFKDWNGDIHVTNGLLRVLSEYGLGNYDNGGSNAGGATYVHAGAALDNAYQRNEKATGTTAGITQRETIHIAGTGFGGFGALNETVGNHIMIGRVTLDADATIGGPSASSMTSIRYHLFDFNGHQLTVAKQVGLGSLPVANDPAVPIVVNANALLTFTGNGVPKSTANAVVQVGQDATVNFESLNSLDSQWNLHFVSNGTVNVASVPSFKCTYTNTWNGVVLLHPGCTLKLKPNGRILGFKKAIQGGGDVEFLNDGLLELGAVGHAIRELRLTSGGQIRLPADFTLEIQSFKVGGVAQPEGDYTAANCANVLSGTIRVNPNAQVYFPEPVSGTDYAAAARSQAVSPALSCSASGAVSFAPAGDATLELTFNGLSNLLKRAHFHVDATATDSLTYHKTWTSTNGVPGITRWDNLGTSSRTLYLKNYTIKSASTTNSAGLPRRCVVAYPTIQNYTVNGVTRPYVDMGEFYGMMNTAENTYENFWSPSPTAAGMLASSETVSAGVSPELGGQEYHLVFGDAHRNPTNENRSCLMGRTYLLDRGTPLYIAGRRGLGGKLFAQGNNITDGLRDGRIWADNVVTNSLYVPNWEDVHVYTIIPTNAFAGTTPSDYIGLVTLGSDTYARYGGARYGEILVYSGATNTAADRARIDAYLMKKWTGLGRGAEMAFGTVALTNNAVLKFTCPDYADVGTSYRIDTLAGDGSVTADAKDAFFIENLSPAVTATNTLARLTVENPVTFAESGKVCIAAGRLKLGVYTILDAAQATNPEALDAWTLDNRSSRSIVLRRSGTTLDAVVSGSCLVIIVK